MEVFKGRRTLEMKKRRNIIIILLSLFVFVARAAPVASAASYLWSDNKEGGKLFGEPPPKFTFSTGFFDKYVGPQGAIWYDDGNPVIQSEINIMWPGRTAPYLNFWNSASPRGGLSSDGGDENDWTVGLKHLTEGGLLVDVGITYFDVADLFDVPRDDIYNPFLELSKEFEVSDSHKISPYLRFSPYYPAKGSSPEKGLYVNSGFRHTWQIDPKLDLSQKMGLIYDDGALGLDSGFLGEYMLGFDYKLTESLTLNPCLRLFTPLTVEDSRKTVAAIGGFIEYSF
jgi:hypothetical protein